MTPLDSSIEPPGRSPFSSTVGEAPSSRARAAAHNPAMPAPATITSLGQREAGLVLDVLDPYALGAPEEDRVGVGRVDEVVDLATALLGVGDVLVGRVDENGEVVQQRPLGIAPTAGVDHDGCTAHLDPRLGGRAG